HCAYLTVVTAPRYWRSLFNTVALSLAAMAGTLFISLPVGRLLAWHREFPGRRVLVGLLMFPLSFPGVVVGFLIILLAGRQGVINQLSQWLTGDSLVFAYNMG